VPLLSSTSWDLEEKLIEGSTLVNASGHELIVSWFSACNSTSAAGSAAHVFTLLVKEVNGTKLVSPAIAGFTLSFKDVHPPQVLGYSLKPTSPLRIDEAFHHLHSPSSVAEDSAVEEQINEVQQLEAELDFIKSLIKDKKQSIHDQQLSEFYEELEQCSGIACKVRVVFGHLHSKFSRFWRGLFPQQKSRPHHFKYQLDDFHTVQVPAMISTSDDKKAKPMVIEFPAEPEKCHCKDEKPALPSDESTQSNVDASSFQDSHFREAQPPSSWAVFFRVLGTITGIALIFALCRFCCCSPRRRRDRAARREQHHREKLYRKAERKQRFWDWMRGRRRGNPGRKVADLDEKRGLVNSQEAVLEGAMQDEIRQLEIHQEIKELVNTRDVVDELIRAEEGRAFGGRLNANAAGPAHSSGVSYVPGFTPIKPVPRPILIPPRPTTRDSDESLSPSDGSFSPVSRTTSLPSYRSKPPSYRERESDGEFSDNSVLTDDGVSDDDANDDDEGDWGSGSSVPDFSPRPSAETIRTFV
jgi:hypothetical protein